MDAGVNAATIDDTDDPSFYPPRPAEWDVLLRHAQELLPQLHERASEAREARKIPVANIYALHESNLLRHFQPVRFGGIDLPWGIQFHIGRILAHACPATAWISTVVASQMGYAMRFPQRAQEDVFARGYNVLMGNASASVQSSVEPVAGGYILSGHWRFLSGADHVDWVLLPVSQEPERKDFGVMTLVPRADMTIEDTWFVNGLQGTGSKDVIVSDAFVPKHRALPSPIFWTGPAPGGRPEDSFIARRDIRGYMGSAVMGPLIGAAEAALRTYVDMTRKRLSSTSKRSVADGEIVQIRLAETAAEVRAARQMIEQQIIFLRELGEADTPISDKHLIEIGRDRSLATRLCLDAIERLARSMGANGIFNTNPVNGFVQDVRAAANQIAVNFDRNMKPFGQMALGLPVKPDLYGTS